MAENENSSLIFRGEGSPEGVVEAPVSAAYVDTKNADVYYKVSGTGNTGWELILASVPPMNIDVIAENIAELLTNTVNMTSVFYDIFLNPEPMDVILWQYNDKNELVPISIPNRAKDRSASYTGVGSPEGVVEAPVGAVYIDTKYAVVYYKMSGTDQFGWSAVLSQARMEAYVRESLRPYITVNSLAGYLTNYVTKTVGDMATNEEFGVVKIDGSTVVENSENQIQVAGFANNNNSQLYKIWIGEQQGYNSIETKDENTIYILKDIGEILIGVQEIADVGFPSPYYQDFPLGSSPNTFEAPANGWVAISRKADTSAGSNSYYISLTNNVNGLNVTQYGVGLQDISCVIPVSKGDVISYDYTAKGNLRYLTEGDGGIRFIYSQGLRRES